jgi:trehalose 6-phosphate phosphatase
MEQPAHDKPWCLFLDLDGTVLDIAATPEAARADAQLIQTLRDLDHALDGAVAIVSGRTIASIDDILKPLRLTAVGLHGGETRHPGKTAIVHETAQLPVGILLEITTSLADLDGVFIEDKGGTVAVHYRKRPDAEPLIRRVMQQIGCSSMDFHLLEGRKVFEIVPAGVSKRAAIVNMRTRSPYQGRPAIMIGDDRTDEAAIDAVNGWGGLGLRVAGEHFSAAQADFSGPAEVRDWLKTFADALLESPMPLCAS